MTEEKLTEEKLGKAVYMLLEKITDMIFYTRNVAKEIIWMAKKLGMTPQEFLMLVSSHIKNIEKSKEGYENEEI